MLGVRFPPGAPLMKKRIFLFILVRTLANTLIALGIVFSVLSFWPFLTAELKYRLGHLKAENKQETLPPQTTFGEIVTQLPPLKAEPVNKDFSIVIEKIDVNAPVVENVDSSSFKAYIAALKQGAAHAARTAVPGTKDGKNNNVFIFAHSTLNFWDVPKYNAVFFLLRKLESGDRVTTFYRGERFDYIVFDKRVVEANDVKYLTNPSQEPILTLQTCDPPGTQLRRLIISAKLVT